jgi:hypothetical protein
LTQLMWSRQNRRWCWTPSQNTTSRVNFENGRSAVNGECTQKGTMSRVMVVSRLKVGFWPDGNISPGNCGLFFVWVLHTV